MVGFSLHFVFADGQRTVDLAVFADLARARAEARTVLRELADDGAQSGHIEIRDSTGATVDEVRPPDAPE